MNKVSVSCRIDIDTKKKALKKFKAMDLSTSKAIEYFLREIALTGQIPFDIRQPNLKTIRAINELEGRATKLFHPNR